MACEWQRTKKSKERPYGESRAVIQELWTGVESPIVWIELYGEGWRTSFIFFEYRLSFPCQVVGHRFESLSPSGHSGSNPPRLVSSPSYDVARSAQRGALDSTSYN